jgi:hypothetical protein
MTKKVKPLNDWQKRDLKSRIEDIKYEIKSLTESFYQAKYEWEREIRCLQNQLEGKEPYKMQGGFIY